MKNNINIGDMPFQKKRYCKLNDRSVFSQRIRILSWLEIYGGLTTQEARITLGIMHPAARVMELRKGGFDIMTYWNEHPTSDGKFHRMAKYVLMKKREGGLNE